MVTISFAGSLGSGGSKGVGLARDTGINVAVRRFHGEGRNRSLRDAVLQRHLRGRVVRRAKDEVSISLGGAFVPSGNSFAVT